MTNYKSISNLIDLYPYLTLRTHTIAEYFFKAKSREDLQRAKKFSIQNNVPLLILGGGSNIAFIKEKFDGLIVKNEYIKKEIIKEDNDQVTLLISSGYPTSLIVSYTVEAGIAGFEYQKGLPGTLGGAIAMNSKWTNPISYISDSLQSATILDTQGNFKKVDRSYFQFAYDYSTLKKTGEIFVEGIFQCKKINRLILEKRAKEAFDYRLRTQPHGVATCGCFFKNISQKEQNLKNLPSTSVGYLIDHSGLKNLSVGSFYVSGKHANFIVNKNKGDPKDLIKLLDIIKKKVKKKYAVELEEEVIIV